MMYEEMMKSLPELKTCPFCGEAARLRRSMKKADVISMRIECTGCLSRTRPIRFSAHDAQDVVLEEMFELVENWNKRCPGTE